MPTQWAGQKILKIIFLGAKFIEIFTILYKQLETNFKKNVHFCSVSKTTETIT